MKKFLCLLLAAVLAGLLILPCAAAEPTDFTDRSTIRNYNAVRMLADLGLVAGYSDGSFGPDKLIRREEVAKLMALLADADAEAQGQNAPVPFYDVSESWALPFIAYCAQNEIVLGDNEDLFACEVTSADNVFADRNPAAYDGKEVLAKVRYSAPPSKAVLHIEGDKIKTVFEKPQRAMTPGQSIVFYDDDKLLGGGFIE